MKMVYKVSLIVLVIVVGLLIIWTIWHKNGQSSAPTEKVQRQTISSTEDFTGNIKSKQSAQLGFESSGIAQKVSVSIGDKVTAGQTLATIDTDIGELEVAQARANQSSAAATAASALTEAQSALTTTNNTKTKYM